MSVTAAPLRRLLWLTLLAMVIGLTACSSGSSAGKESRAAEPTSSAANATDENVAVIGGKSITRSELADRLLTGYGTEVLREMMLHEAVTLEARQLGVTVTDEEVDRELRKMSEGYQSVNDFYSSMLQQLGMDRKAVRDDAGVRLLQEKLATRDVNIPEADIQRHYEEHKKEYGPRKQLWLSWILANTKDEAGAVLSRLEQGADFGSLARQYSSDAATVDAGGDLGWVDDGDPFLDSRILSAAGGLRTGEAAGPLKLDDGYAVVLLNGEKTMQGQPYASVREDIRRQLAMEKAVSVHDLEQSLLAKYNAKVLDPRLAGSIIR